jgi:hypothetical protein
MKSATISELSGLLEGYRCSGRILTLYSTCIIPYGERFNARKIERILYAKDLLLNAEWNAHVNERDVYLHRHPAFFGSASDALGDCCGHCPQPQTIEEEETAENDSKM